MNEGLTLIAVLLGFICLVGSALTYREGPRRALFAFGLFLVFGTLSVNMLRDQQKSCVAVDTNDSSVQVVVSGPFGYMGNSGLAWFTDDKGDFVFFPCDRNLNKGDEVTVKIMVLRHEDVYDDGMRMKYVESIVRRRSAEEVPNQ